MQPLAVVGHAAPRLVLHDSVADGEHKVDHEEEARPNHPAVPDARVAVALAVDVDGAATATAAATAAAAAATPPPGPLNSAAVP